MSLVEGLSQANLTIIGHLLGHESMHNLALTCMRSLASTGVV